MQAVVAVSAAGLALLVCPLPPLLLRLPAAFSGASAAAVAKKRGAWACAEVHQAAAASSSSKPLARHAKSPSQSVSTAWCLSVSGVLVSMIECLWLGAQVPAVEMLECLQPGAGESTACCCRGA